MSDSLPAGKLPAELLSSLLARVPAGPDVVLTAGVGRDAAAVRLGDQLLVLKSDPITFATEEIGWYAVHVNANDIACLGATPRWMLATVLLPEHRTTPALAGRILDDLLAACGSLGIGLVGGHTEITVGLDRPIVAGLTVGTVPEEDLVDPRRSRSGDAIVLAGGIAIEGTSLIARELGEELAAIFGEEFVTRCRGFLTDPGISVVPAARSLHRRLGRALRAMHDPTEGGLATGLRELAASAGAGLLVDADAIPVYPETRAICDALGLDPLGLIASGALLAVVEPSAVSQALAELEGAGIPAAAIGTLTDAPGELLIRRDGRTEPLTEFVVDEIARLMAER